MRKQYVILLASGAFLAPNGDEIDVASEGLTFAYCVDATRHSFKYVGSRVLEVPDRFSGYEQESLREHVNFVTTRLN
jgi:hypothetical protein